jgi:hypothetical protein
MEFYISQTVALRSNLMSFSSHVNLVGDSTAVLAYQSPDGSLKAKRISRDHKPTGKKKRREEEKRKKEEGPAVSPFSF